MSEVRNLVDKIEEKVIKLVLSHLETNMNISEVSVKTTVLASEAMLAVEKDLIFKVRVVSSCMEEAIGIAKEGTIYL